MLKCCNIDRRRSLSGAHLSLVDGNPVDARHERMSLDVGHSVLHVPEPLRDVDLQQVLHEVSDVGAKMRRKFHLVE